MHVKKNFKPTFYEMWVFDTKNHLESLDTVPFILVPVKNKLLSNVKKKL